MRKIILKFPLFCLLLLVSTITRSQVKDLPDAFKKNGFIQNIDFKINAMYVNFFTDEEIVSELILFDKAEVVNSDKIAVPIEKLRPGMEIDIDGNLFKVDRYSEAKKITILDAYKIKPTKTARIDFIKDEYSYVDGHKVKLNPGVLITGKNGGKKNAGYKDQTYTKFADIKLGDFVNVSGKYNPDYYFGADEFKIAPESVTKDDKIADTVGKIFHKKIYSQWMDKNKRSKLFNQEVKGKGKIYNDAELQDYVQRVGLSLVPSHIKEKIQFIFIVMENASINADVRANGLSFINTGLLQSLDNEAQLAAVLGHEISHAIYEHIAKETRDRNRNEKNKGIVSDAGAIGKNLLAKGGNLFKTKDASKAAAEKESTEKTRENLESLSTLVFDVRMSDYSIDQEFQADRVGLSLMAMANYDPREAPMVWKNIYLNYNIYDDTPEGQSMVKALRKEVTKDQTKTPRAGASSDITKGAEWVNFIAKTQAGNLKSRSFKTHPDEIKRFQDLNRLVAMYWADPNLLGNAVVAEDVYRKKAAKLKTLGRK